MIRTKSEGFSNLAFITEHEFLNGDVVTVEAKIQLVHGLID